MHEWMEPYSHRVAQWRIPESSGTGAGCVPLDRTLMPTLNELNRKSSSMFAQISVHFAEMSIWFGNILLTEWKWMREIDHRWSIFYLHTIYAQSVVKFVTWSHCRTSWVDEIQSHDRYAYSLAMNYARALLQGRRETARGPSIIIHRTSANQATQYTGNWAWTFRLVTRSSDHFSSRAKQ